MDSVQDYFSVNEGKPVQRSDWSQEWPHIVSPWETTTPGEMPIWQYTAAALHHGEPQMAYYPHGSPISPNAPAVMSSPSTVFANDGRFTPMTPIYDMSNPSAKADRSPPQMMHLQVPEFTEGADGDGSMDDDSEEGYTWDSNRSPNTPSSASNNRQQRPSSHRRSNSANENSLKNAKRAHTVVERNYRERLNDKIADLALYLFETSSDSRTKPSKSLVMTRAKERLKQLESRNKGLEAEVTKLRQHIAILDHIVTTTKSAGATPPQTS